MAGIQQAFNQFVSSFPSTFRVWSPVQTQSKNNFTMGSGRKSLQGCLCTRRWTEDTNKETQAAAKSEGGSGPRLHTQASCPDEVAGLSQGGRRIG